MFSLKKMLSIEPEDWLKHEDPVNQTRSGHIASRPSRFQ